MSDSPPPSWPDSQEVEALVARAIGDRIDPLRAQLVTVGRGLAILAERVPRSQLVDQLTSRIDTLTSRVDELVTLERTLQDGLDQMGARLDASTSAQLAETRAELVERLGGMAGQVERAVAGDTDARWASSEELRQAVAAAVEEAVARVDSARVAATERLIERITALEAPLQRDADERRSESDGLRQALAVAVSHAVSKVEQARTFEADRILERMDALASEAQARQAEAEAFRQTMAAALEQAVAWIEAAVTTDTGRLLERLDALEAPLTADADARRLDAESLRTLVATTVEEALGRVEQLRTAVAGTVEAALAHIEVARTADATRVLDQVAALEGPLNRDAIARQAQVDDLRHTVVTTVDQAVHRIEMARAADAARFLEQMTELTSRAEADARRRDEQAAALIEAVDQRLQALHLAGAEAGDARDERLVARLEGVTAEHGAALVAHLDERTAAIKDLESIPVRVAAEVQAATATALTTQVEPLVARLVEACDNLAHEGGRIEAMARAHAGEARAVEERVAGLFVEVAERAESAVDHSRARIAEGQVALSTRFDALVGELMTAVSAAADRLEGRLTETAEGLRAAGGHQNGALLDAVNRSAQQLGDGLAEIRSALFASGTESAARGAEADQRAESLAERLDALRATVESMRHDPRLEALVVEQVAAREAQLAAIQAVSGRIDEVGPVVARALLAEVERAIRAANAAEEAVASLRPEALRSALGDAADEIRAAAARLDEAMAGMAERVSLGLDALAGRQAEIRAELAGLERPADEASVARMEELDRSVAEALSGLGATVATSRDELLEVVSRALERSTAVANEVAAASRPVLDDLRVSQTVLREAVQDGAHKAELAALDIRGLRERLTPHLVALAEATTRRAEADQAGFDAVLARLDQLLAVRPK